MLQDGNQQLSHAEVAHEVLAVGQRLRQARTILGRRPLAPAPLLARLRSHIATCVDVGLKLCQPFDHVENVIVREAQGGTLARQRVESAVRLEVILQLLQIPLQHRQTVGQHIHRPHLLGCHLDHIKAVLAKQGGRGDEEALGQVAARARLALAICALRQVCQPSFPHQLICLFFGQGADRRLELVCAHAVQVLSAARVHEAHAATPRQVHVLAVVLERLQGHQHLFLLVAVHLHGRKKALGLVCVTGSARNVLDLELRHELVEVFDH